MSENAGETGQNPNQAFFEKAERSLRELFDRAQAAHELHFAMALMPEFRGEQDAGWSTADESVRAYDEFAELVRSLPKTPARVRVVLAFYMHVAEGAGFYEIPKKLLLTIEGRGNNWPSPRANSCNTGPTSYRSGPRYFQGDGTRDRKRD
jgi:hypothetical protein